MRQRRIVQRAEILLVLLPTIIYAFSTATIPSIRFLPTEIELYQVCKQYPLTWQRRFLSSVPIRDYALNNLSLILHSHQLVLVQGASSSGKSTLLQAIHQPYQVTAGRVEIRCYNRHHRADNDDDYFVAAPAQPVYLDRRPPVENRRSIQQVLNAANKNLDDQAHAALVCKFAMLLGLYGADDDSSSTSTTATTPAWSQRRAADLSPSETYRLALLQACIESCCSDSLEKMTRDSNNSNPSLLCFPSPVLLLDEWLDTETSTVVQAVQESLARLVSGTGAVVCAVTHKGERWKAAWVNRTVTLNRGEILS